MRSLSIILTLGTHAHRLCLVGTDSAAAPLRKVRKVRKAQHKTSVVTRKEQREAEQDLTFYYHHLLQREGKPGQEGTTHDSGDWRAVKERRPCVRWILEVSDP